VNVLNLVKRLFVNHDLIVAPNLCDRLTEEDLTAIGNVVWEGYNRDKTSRSAWERRMEAGMDLAMQIQKAKNWPWPDCANVIFPLVTIAALQFSARSYASIVQGTDIARYRVIGEDPKGLARAHADRISRHMSWQVLEEDVSFEEQHDRLLINLAIVGTSFIKTQYSPTVGHNTSELILARDFVLDYYAKSVEACARKTHVFPLHKNEIYERVKDGRFRDVLNEAWFNSNSRTASIAETRHNERAGLNPPQIDDDTPFRFFEQHRLLDLDQDGYAEPYIVTMEENSKCVCRIVARFDRDEDVDRADNGEIRLIRPTEYFTKYSFIPAPDGGIYDVGFGILLGPLNEAVNTGINQLLDTGTMQNSMGGFLGRGAKIRGGVYTMAPWEWKRVDSQGDDLRKNMVPFPERQPSNVMFQLLGLLINYTDRVAGTVDTMVGENPGQNTPAETSRNMTEQGMQVYSAIFKRVWRSMKEEFKKLHKLNSMFLPSRQTFGTTGSFIMREDYKSNADLIVPSADPNITSPGQRLQQALLVRQAAHTVPGYDVQVAEKRFLQAARVEGIEEIYPGPEHVPPLPNPKLQVEQLKAEVKNKEISHQKWEFAHDMMEQRRLNDATIAKLFAEVQKLLSEVGVEKAAAQIQTFEIAIDAMQAHGEMLNDRIKMLMEATKDGEGSSESGRGKVPSMAGRPNNAGVLQAPGDMGGGSQGPMGGGSV
jgi:chaperonin GroES